MCALRLCKQWQNGLHLDFHILLISTLHITETDKHGQMRIKRKRKEKPTIDPYIELATKSIASNMIIRLFVNTINPFCRLYSMCMLVMLAGAGAFMSAVGVLFGVSTLYAAVRAASVTKSPQRGYFESQHTDTHTRARTRKQLYVV